MDHEVVIYFSLGCEISNDSKSSPCGQPASSAITPVASVHKSRGDNMCAVEEMMCVSVTKGA